MFDPIPHRRVRSFDSRSPRRNLGVDGVKGRRLKRIAGPSSDQDGGADPGYASSRGRPGLPWRRWRRRGRVRDAQVGGALSQAPSRVPASPEETEAGEEDVTGGGDRL